MLNKMLHAICALTIMSTQAMAMEGQEKMDPCLELTKTFEKNNAVIDGVIKIFDENHKQYWNEHADDEPEEPYTEENWKSLNVAEFWKLREELKSTRTILQSTRPHNETLRIDKKWCGTKMTKVEKLLHGLPTPFKLELRKAGFVWTWLDVRGQAY